MKSFTFYASLIILVAMFIFTPSEDSVSRKYNKELEDQISYIKRKGLVVDAFLSTPYSIQAGEERKARVAEMAEAFEMALRKVNAENATYILPVFHGGNSGYIGTNVLYSTPIQP